MAIENEENEQKILDAYCDVLELMCSKSKDLLRKVAIPKNLSSHTYVAIFFATLIEYIEAALLLSKNKIAGGSHSIFRSFLEAYVDFENLANDESYFQILEHKNCVEWIRVLEAADGNNPYLTQIAKHEDHDAIIREFEQKKRRTRRAWRD